MDPVTSIVTSIRVRDARLIQFEAAAPWGYEVGGFDGAKFGLVTRGDCQLGVSGQDHAIALKSGDCYLLPYGAPHSIRDQPDTQATSADALIRQPRGERVVSVTAGARCGDATSILAARFVFDRASSQLLSRYLPPVIHVPREQTACLPVQVLIELLAGELATPELGTELAVTRFAELLFVQAVRFYMAQPECDRSRWLGTDPVLGPVLEALHAGPERPWTVDSLARVAGMSRSAFAARFESTVGDTPLRYLTRWRMERAACLLQTTDKAIAEIATLTGYESDATFSRAFRRTWGMSPGQYRKTVHTTHT